MVPHPVRAQDCSRLPQERKSSRLSRCKTLLLLLQYSDLHQWTIWRREGRMPYANMPWIQQGQLVLETGPRIPLDTPAWFRWLETATHFCYTSARTPDRLTARKEKRRHAYYWYGYLKNASKLHNTYLGKSPQLTSARLEQACDQLVRKAQQTRRCPSDTSSRTPQHQP